jgi:hypothetical protein
MSLTFMLISHVFNLNFNLKWQNKKNRIYLSISYDKQR